MKTKKIFLILLFITINVFSQKIECEKAIDEYVEQINNLHIPRINLVKEIIAKIEKRGLDPRKTYDVSADMDVDYVALLEANVKIKNQDLERISGEIESCDDVKSLQNFLQTIFEGILINYSAGFTYFLPDEMKHVDWSLVLAGHITGGENSVVNKSKKDFYKRVGWGKEHSLRKLLDNPLQPQKWGKIKVKKPKITIGKPKITVKKPSGKIFGKKWSF
jgi:hypothetical protein